MFPVAAGGVWRQPSIWSCRDARRSIPGCRLLRGSGRIRRRTRISHSIRITWKRPARIFTDFARWPSAASLADAVKDAAVVTQVPELGPVWLRQVQAQEGWQQLQARGLRAAEGRVRRGLGTGRLSAAAGPCLQVAQPTRSPCAKSRDPVQQSVISSATLQVAAASARMG